jgi:hypothetical protein
MGRVGPLGIVIGRPLADTVAGLRPGLEATQINAFVFRFADLRFSDRQRRSIIRLSIQRPLPSIDIFTSASFSSSIQSLLRIPRVCGHRIHEHVATDSTSMWPPVPRHVATPLR